MRTPGVSHAAEGVSELRARGVDLRRGHGPGQYAFHKQATDQLTKLERIEPEEPKQFRRFGQQVQERQRIEPERQRIQQAHRIGLIAKRELVVA
jgi:hypothetical protein